MIPNYRGTWDQAAFYDTSDLVMSAGGVKLYSLTKDTSTVGSYQSSTAPENDPSNWIVVLDFPDSGTAALWVGSIGTVLGGIGTIGLIATGIITLTRDTAKDITQAAGNAVANAPAVLTLQSLVSRHTADFDTMKESLQSIVTALALPRA